jgi:hypothetical protein
VKTISLAAFFCLLMCDIAKAECAWVLWQKSDYNFGKSSEKVSWELKGAFPQYKQCMENQTDLFERLRIFWTDVTTKSPSKNEKVEAHSGVGGPSQIIITTESGISVFDFYCLPDTIDPRK